VHYLDPLEKNKPKVKTLVSIMKKPDPNQKFTNERVEQLDSMSKSQQLEMLIQ
jgi:hypothetical protein